MSYYDDERFEDADRDYDEDRADRQEFADFTGRSAIRRETRDNPRDLPCPKCERPDMLTRKDAAAHYQCDTCADTDEGIGF